jgi:TorA maturation chaperone TorD
MGTSVEASLDLAAWSRLLALGFTVPHETSLAEMRWIADALLHDAPPGPGTEALAQLAGALRDPAVVAAAPSDYSSLFDRDAPCPPYEGSYDGDPFRQVRQMSDVAGFYRAFGAEAAGPYADRPDHVACELEFLSFLVLREIAAEEEGREEDAVTCRAAADAFLRDHLGRWLGPFCEAVAASAPSALYAALARFGAVAVRDELARRGIRPAPLGERRRWSVEADELVCGHEGASSAAQPRPRAGGPAPPPPGAGTGG